MQLPAQKKKAWIAEQGLSISFHIGLHGGAYVRKDERTDGRTEVTS